MSLLVTVAAAYGWTCGAPDAPVRLAGPPAPPTAGLQSCVDPGAVAAGYGAADTYDGVLRTTHFELDYDSSADIESETYLAVLADALEVSWSVEVEELGWPAPEGSGDHYVQVILANFPSDETYGGVASTASCGGEDVGYITLNTDLWYRSTDYLYDIPAHELTHLLQYASGADYSAADDVWIYEATAVWMEDRVFEDTNTYAQDFLPEYLAEPGTGLTAYTYATGLQYAHFVWPLFVDEHVGGPDLVRALWTERQGRLLDTFDSLIDEPDPADPARWAGFLGAMAAFDVSDHDVFAATWAADGAGYYAVDTAVPGAGDTPARPDALGATYLHLVAPEGDGVRFTLEGAAEDAWVGGGTDGGTTVEADAVDGALTLELPGSEVWIGVGPTAQAAGDWSWSAEGVEATEDPVADEGGGGCGCGTAGRGGGVGVAGGVLGLVGVVRRRRAPAGGGVRTPASGRTPRRPWPLVLTTTIGCGRSAPVEASPPSVPVVAGRASGDYEVHPHGSPPHVSPSGRAVAMLEPGNDSLVAVLGRPGHLAEPDTRVRFIGPEPVWWLLAPDGHTLVGADRDGSVWAWTVGSGERTRLGALDGPRRWTRWLADGRLAVAVPTGADHGTSVSVWDVSAAHPPQVVFTDDWADDVVLDRKLRPRLLVHREDHHDDHGIRWSALTFRGEEARAGLAPASQVPWLLSSDVAPHVGDGPITLLAGDDRSAPMVLTSGRWVGVAPLDWGDTVAQLTRPDGGWIAAAVEQEVLRWSSPGDPSVADDLRWVGNTVGADVRILDVSEDDDVWVVEARSGDHPDRQFVVDRRARTIERFGRRWGPVDEATWSPVDAVTIQARDGHPLSLYLSRPLGFPAPWPVVVRVHGGPWSTRDRVGFDVSVQKLADLGVATLSVNFRGSSGYGWSDTRSAEWDEPMVDDVEDGLRWARDQHLVEATTAAVEGTSFGGWAALRLAERPGSAVRCAVSLFGPNSLLVPNGHMVFDEGADWLRARSPETDAAKLTGPVLLVTGARDGPDSDAVTRPLVQAAGTAGVDVSWLRFADAGHGAATPTERDAIATVVSQFEATCLDRVDHAPPVAVDDLLLEWELRGTWGHPANR